MVVFAVRSVAFLAAWFCAATAALSADEVLPPSVPPPIASGLVHYWPNLWNALDEITGASGMVMGILPEAADGAPDEVAFNDETGWVQLPVNLQHSNDFAVSVWLRPAAPKRAGTVVLALYSGPHRWWLQNYDGQAGYRFHAPGLDQPGIELALPIGEWAHVAITKRGAGSVAIWKNGALGTEKDLGLPGSIPLDLISVGNCLKGDIQWQGALSELRVFDRMLAPEELRVLHAAGFARHPVRITPARTQALRRPHPINWSTNVSQSDTVDFSFRRYTSEDGLTGNKIQCLHQSRDGYLWVGTGEGLARFDGRRFRAWTIDEPALAPIGHDVISLCEAEDGTLWAGGYGGLLQIRGAELTPFTKGLPEGLIIQVAPAESNTLWIAGFRMDSHDRGPCRVRRYHPDTQTSSDQVVAPGHVRRIVPTPSGLWMATEDPEQLLFWDRSAPAPTVVGKLTAPPLELNLRAESPAPGLRARGWRDPLDPERTYLEILCGDDGPVFHWLSPARNTAANANRWSLPHNPGGWLGAEAGLARRIGKAVKRILFPGDLAPREVTCVSPNREGGIWVGTEGDGLYLVREKLVQVFTRKDGLGGNDIRSVLATRENLVIVGGPEGVFQFQEGRWHSMASVPSTLFSVLSVAQDFSGHLWAGIAVSGSDAMRQFNATNWYTLALPGMLWKHPSSLTVSPSGTLWIGGELGLTWINPPAVPLNQLPGENQISFGRLKLGESLPDVKLLKIVTDSDGNLWVGTLGKGLLRVVGEKVETFTTNDGLPLDICSPALLDDTGDLWIVTSGAVVRRSKGRFQVVDTSHGVPDDYLFDMIEDNDGYFWLPGQRGIHRLNRSELEAVLQGKASGVRSFTLGVRDGLRTPECTSMHYPITAKTSDGHIWVATSGGVATFDPRDAHINTQPLPAIIEHVVAGQRRTFIPTEKSSSKPLMLPPGSGHRLEIHFAATSLIAADRVRFRHQLQGYDSEWSDESDLRQAFYTNLRPGRYDFRVMACNPNGVWNENPTPLALVIAPYFWQRPTFQVLVVLVLGGALFLVHRQRLGVLRRLHELDRQQQLLGERTRIAADMHDDLGAALTQIAILGEVAKSQITEPDRAHSVLTRISESARDVTGRMSDLVWATNPRNDTLENLAAYLREHLARQLEEAGLQARLTFPEELPSVHLSATFRRNILLTVKEALNNALKHGNPTGFMAELKVEPGRLLIRLEDNGTGFDSKNGAPFGNGLGNMRRRIEDLGGTLSLDSAPGKGTRICLSVPIQLVSSTAN